MKNIRTVRTSKKLDLRYLGPFKIIEKINDNAFRLELPKHFRIHDVFNVSLLKKYHPSPVVPGVTSMEPTIITPQLADHQEYKYESILDEKMATIPGSSEPQLHYLIKWIGWPNSQSTWQTAMEVKSDYRFDTLENDYLLCKSSGKQARFRKDLGEA